MKISRSVNSFITECSNIYYTAYTAEMIQELLLNKSNSKYYKMHRYVDRKCDNFRWPRPV